MGSGRPHLPASHDPQAQPCVPQLRGVSALSRAPIFCHHSVPCSAHLPQHFPASFDPCLLVGHNRDNLSYKACLKVCTSWVEIAHLRLIAFINCCARPHDTRRRRLSVRFVSKITHVFKPRTHTNTHTWNTHHTHTPQRDRGNHAVSRGEPTSANPTGATSREAAIKACSSETAHAEQTSTAAATKYVFSPCPP